MANTDKLVSVLTPCYNAEKYIKKLLGSILSQTYPHIEMIIIDDGSTDASASIIQSYVEKFKKKGYTLQYIYQKNQGQSVAINNGLKRIKGDYLVWPDADDYYASSGVVSEMVRRLEDSTENVSMVRVQYNVLDENGDVIQKIGLNDSTRYKTDLFEDAIFGTNGFWYPPGGYMAKVSKLDEMIKRREIYTEKGAGQNFQLYLPLLYKNQCITIEKYLYNIVAHDDSHSRNLATDNERQHIYFRTIKSTLSRLPLESDYKKYLMKRVSKMVPARNTGAPKYSLRTYTKRAVKAVTPYGVMMLYKRRQKR